MPSRIPTCPENWDGKILVPFSPEAELSGVGRTLLPGQYLWYRRELVEAPQAGMRLLLHFGAVDQECRVWLNGRLLGGHTGGYTAFTLDATDALVESNVLLVAVRDGTDTNELSRGKQKTKRGGIWYTPQSGIWQRSGRSGCRSAISPPCGSPRRRAQLRARHRAVRI